MWQLQVGPEAVAGLVQGAPIEGQQRVVGAVEIVEGIEADHGVVQVLPVGEVVVLMCQLGGAAVGRRQGGEVGRRGAAQGGRRTGVGRGVAGGYSGGHVLVGKAQ